MYLPAYFIEQKISIIHQLIERYSFGTLISVDGEQPTVSHLPFLLDSSAGEKGTLWGHMARANCQWKTFLEKREVLTVFHGPHAYISPQWYEPKAGNVPTWDYAVVHSYGYPQVVEDNTMKYSTLERLVEISEKANGTQWKLELNAPVREKLLHQIVVFKIPITRFEAKLKLNQNHEEKNLLNVIEALSQSKSDLAKETGQLMRQFSLDRSR